MDQKLQIIMYHYVRELHNARYPRIKGLTVGDFREQLRFLKESGRYFISVEELLESIYGGGRLPENSVLLTFDDGYIDHFTNVFPILDSMGIPAFFSMPAKIIRDRRLLDVNKIHFILAAAPVEKLMPMVYERLEHYRGGEFCFPSNEELYSKLAVANRLDGADTVFIKRLLQVELPERLRSLIADDLFRVCVGVSEEAFAGELYMSLDQVRMMQRRGMAWGIHGYDHYWMNRMTPEALERDISDALDVFASIVPADRWICCYPYGSVSDEVIACAARFGAKAGVTTEVRSADLERDSAYRLPRLDTVDFPPRSENYLNFM